jgi:hypothetical protein
MSSSTTLRYYWHIGLQLKMLKVLFFSFYYTVVLGTFFDTGIRSRLFYLMSFTMFNPE